MLWSYAKLEGREGYLDLAGKKKGTNGKGGKIGFY